MCAPNGSSNCRRAGILIVAHHGSPQQKQLENAAAEAFQRLAQVGPIPFRVVLAPILKGLLANLKAEVEQGLVGDIERRGHGAALADFLGLAKETLSEGGDTAKDVAAVLVAASFEDTVRRMGSSLADIRGRPDLSEVIAGLKQAGVFQGAPLSTALGFLKFRNDALHADWSKIDRVVVGSCLAFVEGLLLKHFA